MLAQLVTGLGDVSFWGYNLHQFTYALGLVVQVLLRFDYICVTSKNQAEKV